MIRGNSSAAFLLNEAEQRSIKEMWDVRHRQPFCERAVKTAIIAPFRCKALRDAAQKAVCEQFPGYDRIGGGFEQMVYRSGKNVLKLFMSMKHYDGYTPRQLAEKLQVEADVCQGYLRSAWTPTQYDVTSLPSSGRDAVIARQPYVETEQQFASIVSLVADQNVARREKHDYAEKVAELYASTGIYVDLIGVNNVGAVSGSLVTLDTTPFGADRLKEMDSNGRSFTDAITRNVEMLRAA